jgi:hypothetical protein
MSPATNSGDSTPPAQQRPEPAHAAPRPVLRPSGPRSPCRWYPRCRARAPGRLNRMAYAGPHPRAGPFLPAGRGRLPLARGRGWPAAARPPGLPAGRPACLVRFVHQQPDPGGGEHAGLVVSRSLVFSGTRAVLAFRQPKSTAIDQIPLSASRPTRAPRPRRARQVHSLSGSPPRQPRRRSATGRRSAPPSASRSVRRRGAQVRRQHLPLSLPVPSGACPVSLIPSRGLAQGEIEKERR